MSNLKNLFIGELERIRKYNILGFSILISLILIGIFHFTGTLDVTRIFPFLIYLDITSMSILMIGVTMFFEKEEGTLKTLRVAPISKMEYILSKVFANIVTSMITLGILYLYAKLFKEINLNMFGLLCSVILISFFHSLIGFVLTYSCKNFTGLLIGMMKYSFFSIIPILLEEFGMIESVIIKKFLYLIPTKPSLILLDSSLGETNSITIILCALYLVILSILLCILVNKRFNEFAIRESGV